jgi:hypothetical protein
MCNNGSNGNRDRERNNESERDMVVVDGVMKIIIIAAPLLPTAIDPPITKDTAILILVATTTTMTTMEIERHSSKLL